MVRHSSQMLVLALLSSIALAGCPKIYIVSDDDAPLPAQPPPSPETLQKDGPQGPVDEPLPQTTQTMPTPTATPTPPPPPTTTSPVVVVAPPSVVSTIRATPERPIPGQLKARQARSGINIREGPGTNYPVLFSAHPKDTVMITDEVMGADGYPWYQVYHSDWGWVREDLLRLQEGWATVTARQARSVINVREGPSQRYRVIHEAYVGDRFPVADQARDNDGHAWYLLDLNYEGWVRGDLINKGTAAFE